MRAAAALAKESKLRPLTLHKAAGRPKLLDGRNARQLAKTSEYGSPPWMADGARNIFQDEIDVDPASSPRWNTIVRARRIITKREDALHPGTSWGLPGHRGGVTVFHNPPGDPQGELVPAFYARIHREWISGVVYAALWVGFSLEQWRTLQGLSAVHPLDLPGCLPSRRVPYYEMIRGKPTPSKAPSHATYLTLLPPLRRGAARTNMIRRFAEEFGARGKLINCNGG